MGFEWESRLVSIPSHARDWHDRSRTMAGPLSTAPSAFIPSNSSLSQRRRSSAAHVRPAGPPPNLPIPSIPILSTSQDPVTILDPPEESYHYSDSQISDSGAGPSSFTRSMASPGLTAITAFSQSRQFPPSYSHDPSPSQSVENLSDPPPLSILPSASSRALSQHQEMVPDRLLLSPPEPRNPEVPPSSRRALTRALDLAREAVKLDSANDDPYAAVVAYGQSVALLSEVMERVRNGEDSREPYRRRNGRRRSAAAQEEEVRRLKSIHDTYADRMNILSLIYSIPPQPHSTASLYSMMSVSTDSNQPPSPTSTSPSSESSDPPIDVPSSQDCFEINCGHDREDDRTGVLEISGSSFLNSSSRAATASNSSLYHPYATTVQYDAPPKTIVTPPTNPSPPRPPMSTNRNSTIRRGRAVSNLPPPPPPPSNSPPPAPIGFFDPPPDVLPSQVTSYLEVDRSQGGSISSHQRTGSGSSGRLAALEEETERVDVTPIAVRHQDDLPVRELQRLPPETPRKAKRDSHPLPPIPAPSPDGSPGTTPRNLAGDKTAGSPQTNFVVPKLRDVSALSLRAEVADQLNLINPSTTMGTISQRRFTKSSDPSTSCSSSSTELSILAGSIPYMPRLTAQSLPVSSASSLGIGTRNRALSQPGRRPSLMGGRVSPLDQPPPMPATTSLNGSNIPRNFSSKLNPNPPQLVVQTGIVLTSVSATSLIPPLPVLSGNLPITPTSPLPPMQPNDPLRKPYHMMNLIRITMESQTGGYLTRRLHVPQEVWSQGGAKLTNVPDKVRVVEILCSALEELQTCSSDYFGAGNVSSGLALGIGSVGRKEGEAWISKLEDFSSVCDGVVANFGKKLGVGEGFVLKKNTWVTSWVTRRFDKFTNGKNLDSPAAYVQGLKQLFLHAQLLDEHTRAVMSQPTAPAYAALPIDIRCAAEVKLKRSSEFFASVVLTFVIRDLSQLLDKYAKKCEKWLAE